MRRGNAAMESALNSGWQLMRTTWARLVCQLIADAKVEAKPLTGRLSTHMKAMTSTDSTATTEPRPRRSSSDFLFRDLARQVGRPGVLLRVVPVARTLPRKSRLWKWPILEALEFEEEGKTDKEIHCAIIAVERHSVEPPEEAVVGGAVAGIDASEEAKDQSRRCPVRLGQRGQVVLVRELHVVHVPRLASPEHEELKSSFFPIGTEKHVKES